MLTRKLLIVLTDGGRARLVEQSKATGDFVTIETLDQTRQLRRLRHQVRAQPATRAFASFSSRRHVVGPEDAFRPVKEAFMTEVARRAVAVMRRRRFQGVIVAAPPRLIGALRRRLGRTLIADTLRKDLTKTPDHELHAWFGKGLPSWR
jgi:protein required for attachment to host cells